MKRLSGWTRDRNGSAGTVVPILVGTAVFSASLLVLVLHSHDPGTPPAAPVGDAVRDSEAEALLEMFLSSPGVWKDGELERFGLASPDGGLDRTRLSSIDEREASKDDGSTMDYRDLLNSMGGGPSTLANEDSDHDGAATTPADSEPAADREFQFHLKVEPLHVDPRRMGLDGLRVAYIGEACFGHNTASFVDASCVDMNKDKAYTATRLDPESAWRVFFEPEAWQEMDLLASVGTQFHGLPQWEWGRFGSDVQTVLGPIEPPDSLGLGGIPLSERIDQIMGKAGGYLPTLSPHQKTQALLSMLPDGEGDIYPDSSIYLREQLRPVLARYDAIIVGSHVDHEALRGLHGPLEPWVESGGALIIMGSDRTDMAALLGLVRLNPPGPGDPAPAGPPHSMEPPHPILTMPHTLDWTLYPDPGAWWRLHNIYQDSFVAPLQYADDQPLWLLSDDPGEYGAGRVLLVRHHLHEVTAAAGEQEAGRLLENLILHGSIQDLHILYGPPVPDDRPVASAVRVSYFDDDVLGQVPVRLTLYLWYV